MRAIGTFVLYRCELNVCRDYQKAGEGNRTLVAGLGSQCITTMLRPHRRHVLILMGRQKVSSSKKAKKSDLPAKQCPITTEMRQRMARSPTARARDSDFADGDKSHGCSDGSSNVANSTNNYYGPY